MNVMKRLTLAALIACAGAAHAAAPAPAPAATRSAAPSQAHVQAAYNLLAAMQAEKMMRMTAGASRYPTEAARLAVMDKLLKVPPATIYQKLALPLAKLVSEETALEMTKMYSSPYGKRLLHDTYNSGPSMYGPVTEASKAERAELARPALVKAGKALKEAEEPLRHEMFVLLQEINRK
ncbi:MAG: hypothetical protein ABIT83_25680 [Massilia sp.]